MSVSSRFHQLPIDVRLNIELIELQAQYREQWSHLLSLEEKANECYSRSNSNRSEGYLDKLEFERIREITKDNLAALEKIKSAIAKREADLANYKHLMSEENFNQKKILRSSL